MKKLFIWLSVAVVAGLFCAVAGQAQALSWEQVNTDGFGSANNTIVFNPSVWGGYMYVGAGNTTNGASVWRSSGGTDWQRVSEYGFGDSKNHYISDFAVFRGDLFAISYNSAGTAGSRVWHTRNGTDWTAASSAGFGDANNKGQLVALEVFGDYLYATAGNTTTGVEVWRTADGANWSQVNTDGFGSSVNYYAEALYVYNDQLYCGTNSTGGGTLWRTSDGTSWTSLISAGFGNPNNLMVAALVKFDSKLYAFTWNVVTGSEVWSSSEGTTWSRVTTTSLAAKDIWPTIRPVVVNGSLWVGFRNDFSGFSLHHTADGTNWTQDISGGKGNVQNFALYGMAVWGDRMYLGVSNLSTGMEMWRSERIGVMEVTTTSLATAYEGKNYEQKLSVANSTPGYQWSISDGELPAGLNIDANTGTISGTPKEGGNHTFIVTVTDYGTPMQTATQEFTLKVICKGHIVTGAGAGATPWVRAFNAYGTVSAKPNDLMVFASTFRGGINVATGDLDGDGIDEIVAAPRGNGAPRVDVFNKDGTLQKTFYAYDSKLRCGTDVAVADLDGNGTDEIITTPGTGCGPQIKVFNRNGTAVLTKGFFAYASGLRVGVRVAAGDINQDGKAEIVTAPERGAAAQIKAFDYAGKAKGTTGFYPYGMKATGADVAVADLDGNGKDEIVTVPGEGYPAQVRIFDSTGKAKLNAGFYAYPQSIKTGFLISAGDLNGDGRAEIVTVPKTANAAQVRTFKYNGQAVFTPGFYAYAASQKAGADVAAGNF